MRKRNSSYSTLLAISLFTVMVLAAAPAAAVDPPVVINEIQVSTTGTDWEFVELQGVAATDLTGLALVGIESDAGSASAGTIDLAIDLSGQAIPADGFWLAISPTGASTYGVSGEMAISDNSFENSSATYFLVSNLTGSQDDDLDTDDDGTLDIVPLSLIHI